MFSYLGKRVVHAIFVVWAAYTVTFALLYLLPSNPVAIMLSQGDAAGTAEQAAALNHQYGFDKSPLAQYFVLLGRAATGDFGTSVQTGRAVFATIGQALPQTLSLGVTALLFSLVLGFTLSMAVNLTGSRTVRRLLSSIPPFVNSLPVFWVGLLLLQIFAFKLGWFPPLGNKGIASLVLPALTLALPTGALYAHIYTQSLQGVLRQPHVDTAKTKGASTFRVLLRHALRNGAIPVFTIVGMTIGDILAGAVVTETVFNRNGIGRLTQTSVNAQDIPVVQGLVVVFAASFVVANLLIDLLYPVLDPRVRAAWGARSKPSRMPSLSYRSMRFRPKDVMSTELDLEAKSPSPSSVPAGVEAKQ